MAHDVTLVLLIALPSALGLLVIVRVLAKLRREHQAVEAMRNRAQMDQWDAAGAEAVRRRPMTELERVLDEHARTEQLRADAMRLSQDADRFGLRDVHDVFPEEESR